MGVPTCQPLKPNKSLSPVELVTNVDAVVASAHEHDLRRQADKRGATFYMKRGARQSEVKGNLGRVRAVDLDGWPTGHVERRRGRAPP